MEIPTRAYRQISRYCDRTLDLEVDTIESNAREVAAGLNRVIDWVRNALRRSSAAGFADLHAGRNAAEIASPVAAALAASAGDQQILAAAELGRSSVIRRAERARVDAESWVDLHAIVVRHEGRSAQGWEVDSMVRSEPVRSSNLPGYVEP